MAAHNSGENLRPGVFICYRRQDSAGEALRVYTLLSAKLGEEPGGSGYHDSARRRLRRVDREEHGAAGVVIPIIGRGSRGRPDYWATPDRRREGHLAQRDRGAAQPRHNGAPRARRRGADAVLGGTATWGELLRTIGFAQTPGVLQVLGIIPVLGGLIRFAVAIWVLIAGIIAIRQALDVGTGKAILTAALGWLVIVLPLGHIDGRGEELASTRGCRWGRAPNRPAAMRHRGQELASGPL